MAALFATKTRLKLLAEVAAGRVMTDTTAADDVIWLCPNAPTDWETRERVTARVRELEAAGWVEQPHPVDWRLTLAGWTVLWEARRG